MAEYIEREAAEKIASQYGCTNGSALGRHSGIADCIADEISKIPAADVTPIRHGRWVMLDECSNEGVYCSNCHKKVYKLNYANQKLKSKYCSNCGCEMLEDET